VPPPGSPRVSYGWRVATSAMWSPVGEGVSEMRIDYGPGYRVYFIQPQRTVALLLCGGDKSRQARDIARAKKLAKQLKE
jgi:putative addiction module killer protein